MPSEIDHAFAHPAARSQSVSGELIRDRILMTDYVVSAEIGAFQSERGVTQRIRFDVVVEVSGAAETAADDVDQILSYDTIVEAIDASLSVERVSLLETLASRVADEILRHPRSERVFVRIGKLDRGPYVLGVEIVRDTRHEARLSATTQADQLYPVVVFVSHMASQADDFSDRLTRLTDRGRAIILAPGWPQTPVPRVDAALAQRRIDLLALEQFAWMLAAADPRCIVVSSRTELEHSMRNGSISVWAPSNMVLNALDKPKAPEIDPLVLANWLAESFDAPPPVALEAVDDLAGTAAV